ncbi:sensor histidine kinase [Clostridium sp. ZS2-4]|uniref:sensor histidine kinase n=1 Tax=Clostridium sp. ZS2-4 TaxID=2987703 RepID=UPI00227A8920|nr:HAMP domain-containing sensor histidine kinase [Clostridium sp. ZS2-4]MCY6355542.1 HAMP domain-containing sensor histidine kinase [Clostridium sp. ZS2-4]
MEQSLRRKLTFSHMFVAIVCILLISVGANIFLQKQFENYIIQTIESKSKDIVSMVSQQYSSEGKWNYNRIESIGIDALENGLIISIQDSQGEVIWDANIYNNGKCESIIAHMAKNMTEHYSNWQGGYKETQYNLLSKSKKVGIVKIGHYGPFYYNDNDMVFLDTLNKILIAVGAVSLFIAVILGVIIASGLSRPISRVIDTAEKISDGKYTERINEKSDIKEINKLTTTINYLAKTLQEHEMLQKRLTEDVSHELRTPLTTLQSHMEAIIDEVWEPTMDRMKSCYEEIIRINRLVSDLEKLTIYESENFVLNKSNFDVSEVIKNIILNFESKFLSKNIEVKYVCKKQMIYADKDKISQMCINLISNAFKYTTEGGKIEIILDKKKEFIEFSVKDNGIGIAESDIAYIFERFYRADKSRTRLTGGAGIGLTITKRIVEAHKGKITVSSKEKQGTEFKVILPI